MSKGRHSFLAIIVAFSFLTGTSPAASSPARALGQVLQSEGGHLGEAKAAVGATIFSGDTLSTEARGSLHVRAAGAQLYLLAHTFASLQAMDQGAAATLTGGTIIFSTATSQGFELRASSARLRAKANVPTVAQVTLLGPKELLVTCRRGAIEFAVNDESDVIPEGASYRVLIDPPAAMAADENPQQPRKSGRQRKAFLFLLFGGVALGTIWGIHEALESPDQP